MNQHDLMVSVLTAAGGEPIENHAAPGYTGKIADILFPAENVIVEVKSLTTDRAASDETSEAVGEMFSRHTHMGAPVIFGTVTAKLHDLSPAIAMNTLRIAGKRVLAEAKAANAQLKATKAALDRPEAIGLLALITPPFRLDRHSIVALVGDSMRDNRCRSIDQLFLVETPLAAPAPYRRWGNSFMSLHSRPDGERFLPQHLAEAIGRAWSKITWQPAGQGKEEDYHQFGATS
ncbi:hypothetical protein [Sphingomonas koreensis]|uniref:hypothetical protein n=1 Tax=Sphingomonas koreensis TaxID=93064 RepID=UPI00234E5500|nr:hypothetical protein [Sphingomonas koreensis]MDC7812811.1 hypothetical protein [Sphingomonas koreensis]